MIPGDELPRAVGSPPNSTARTHFDRLLTFAVFAAGLLGPRFDRVVNLLLEAKLEASRADHELRYGSHIQACAPAEADDAGTLRLRKFELERPTLARPQA
jgi:hypothetical protein